MGIARIPTSKIREFGVWHELDGLDIEDLCYIIGELDKRHVKQVSDEIAAKSKRSGK